MEYGDVGNEEHVGTGIVWARAPSPVQPSACGNGRLRPFSRAQRGAFRTTAMLSNDGLQPSTELTIPNPVP